MTSALIADNHLALDALIQDRLRSNLTGVTVGGFVDYLDLLAGKTVAVPAVFVVYDGDRLATGSGSPHQSIVSQSWQAVIVTAPVDGDMAATGALMASVIRALSGVRMSAELKPLSRGNDAEPMLYGSGWLFTFLAFSQPLDMR